MNDIISNKTLSRLSALITENMGLNFPEKRWSDLQRGISSATSEFGFKDTESCSQWLLSAQLTRSQIEILASHLTIGETYFFRKQGIGLLGLW